MPLAMLPPPSLTCTVNVAVAALEGGVPVSAPDELSAAQPGSPLADQMYPDPAPPEALNTYRYGAPTAAAGSDGGSVMVNPSVSTNVPLAVLDAESVPRASKRAVPEPAGGTPVSAPSGVRVSQFGRPAAVHVYPVPLPPDAANTKRYMTPTE